MNTIQELRTGKLDRHKKIKIAGELNTFPTELFRLKDTLEYLDLSGNKLSKLPDEISLFKKLKIAFFSENNFTEFPEILSQCPKLEIIGFKANKINYIPKGSFPKDLRWLILTNNNINKIPECIGDCHKMQKLMLAGNNINFLPEEMSHLNNLELLRISANKINSLPEWLFSLPLLTWLAYAGNPCCNIDVLPDNFPEINWDNLIIEEQLGQGASGIISKARWKNSLLEKEGNNVAVKIFKGEVTSDGLPIHEMNANIIAGKHTSLVEVMGKLTRHPGEKSGLVMKLIPTDYFILGNPPSLDTCTRDVFSEDFILTAPAIIKILKGIASVSQHLHKKHLMHGDLYAHNILINNLYHPILSDFGAATSYQKETPARKYLIERMEVRAFGCLIEDLLNHVIRDDKQSKEFQYLSQIQEKCFSKIDERPDFGDIVSSIDEISDLDFL